jgi:Zn-finger nucleic acid-binding protein
MDNTQFRPCPRCGEQIPEGKTVCPNCKKIISETKDSLVTRGVKAVCPVCKIPIYPARLGTYEILHCAECGSTAYKREVLMKMQALEPKQLATGDEEANHITPPYFEKRDKPPFLICPYCGKKMQGKKLGPMQVDICEECRALFLDGEKYKHINDLLGPYKMQAMNEGREGGRRGRR